MRISHPMVMALSTLAVLERTELKGIEVINVGGKKEEKPAPPSMDRADYPSRQTYRAAVRDWNKRAR